MSQEAEEKAKCEAKEKARQVHPTLFCEAQFLLLPVSGGWVFVMCPHLWSRCCGGPAFLLHFLFQDLSSIE